MSRKGWIKSLATTYSPALLCAVPLAMKGLTSEFGMVSGISLSLLSPSKSVLLTWILGLNTWNWSILLESLLLWFLEIFINIPCEPKSANLLSNLHHFQAFKPKTQVILSTKINAWGLLLESLRPYSSFTDPHFHARLHLHKSEDPSLKKNWSSRWTD